MIAADELSIGSRPFTLTSPVDHGSPRLRRPSMTFHSGTTRRGFLKSSALALASLGIAPRALSASKLNLKKPIKIGCQTILSGPLGGYGEFMRKGALQARKSPMAQTKGKAREQIQQVAPDNDQHEREHPMLRLPVPQQQKEHEQTRD